MADDPLFGSTPQDIVDKVKNGTWAQEQLAASDERIPDGGVVVNETTAVATPAPAPEPAPAPSTPSASSATSSPSSSTMSSGSTPTQ